MDKLIKGQTVWVKPIRNAARHNAKVKEVVITTVGRKYFTLEGWDFARKKFSIETLEEVSEYSADYEVYLSLEDLEHAEARPEKLKTVERLLYSLTFPQLVEVEDFIKSKL